MSDRSDDDGFPTMDEWFAMTDEERAAIERTENAKWAEHAAWYERQSAAYQQMCERGTALRFCLENRKRLRNPKLCTIPFIVEMWREGLRRNQRRLLAIRIWRKTGSRPTTELN